MEPPGSVLGGLPRALGTAVRMVAGTVWVLLAMVLPALVLGPAGAYLGTLTFFASLVVVHSFVKHRKFAVRRLGHRRIVEEKRLGVGTDETCDACGGPADEGLVRRYARQFALLGSAVYTAEWGGNVYCPDCEAAAELERTASTVPVRDRDRGPAPEPATDPVAPRTVEVESAD